MKTVKLLKLAPCPLCGRRRKRSWEAKRCEACENLRMVLAICLLRPVWRRMYGKPFWEK